MAMSSNTTTTTTTATTRTTTTRPINSNPSTTKKASPSNTKMDYVGLRNSNWETIDKYYQKLVIDYQTKYQQYTNGLNSNSKNERDYAKYIESSVNDYKNQLINVYQEMLKVLDMNDEIIREQKTRTEKLEKENDKLIAGISQLKSSKNEVEVDAQSHIDNRQMLDDDLATLKSWNLYYKIGMWFLAGCVVILFIYRVWQNSISSDYTSFTTTSGILGTSTNTTTSASKTATTAFNNKKMNNTKSNGTMNSRTNDSSKM